VELDFDVIVLGAGAAGLMCAIEAGKRGRKVAVIERSERPGKKILISGGGRCNFTNLHCRPENFLSSNPHFAKSALARYTPADFVELVQRHGIAYHEKKLGQLFCDGPASDITAMLDAECRHAGVHVFAGTGVDSLYHTKYFISQTKDRTFRAAALVVATGGLSIPKMGASGLGYDIARQFGLKVRECRPALVPLTFSAEDRRRYCDLAGASL
jgi:predicted Rossmann fold flavoprotein